MVDPIHAKVRRLMKPASHNCHWSAVRKSISQQLMICEIKVESKFAASTDATYSSLRQLTRLLFSAARDAPEVMLIVTD